MKSFDNIYTSSYLDTITSVTSIKKGKSTTYDVYDKFDLFVLKNKRNKKNNLENTNCIFNGNVLNFTVFCSRSIINRCSCLKIFINHDQFIRIAHFLEVIIESF